MKAWNKIELNSCYGLSPVSVIFDKYDADKSRQITENGKKLIKLMKEIEKTNNNSNIK